MNWDNAIRIEKQKMKALNIKLGNLIERSWWMTNYTWYEVKTIVDRVFQIPNNIKDIYLSIKEKMMNFMYW